MQAQSDTLYRLAAALGLDATSSEFRRVWGHLSAEGWSETEVGRAPGEARRAGFAHLRIVRAYSDVPPTPRRSRRTRGAQGWRGYAAALERHAADVARQDPEVVAFRRDILSDRMISPTNAHVQAWLQAHPQHHVPLTGLAQSLAQVHGWMPHDALMFILTNETPPRSPLRMQVQGTTGSTSSPRIMVEAEAWIPPAQVARAFRDLRDRIQRSTGSDSRRRARALSPRAVALVAFIEATRGSWRERLDAWNAANPKACFKDRANFRRAYETARRRLDVSPAFVGG